MERNVAVKTLGKILGKEFGYRVDPKAPTSEERKAARDRLPALNATKTQAEKAMQDYRHALLANDAKYQELVKTWKAARTEVSKAASITHHFKITVGRSTFNGLFFSVSAQGDSCEEVIAEVKGDRANGRP